MTKWMTIAAVIPEWKPDFLSLDDPIQLDDGVSLAEFPEWCRTSPMIDNLGLVARNRIRDEVRFALISSYEGGDAIGERHPWTIGGVRRSRQSVAREALNMACLSMWIALPTGFSYQTVIDASERDGAWRVRAVGTYDPFLPNAWNMVRSHTHVEVDAAAKLYRALKEVDRSSAVWTAIRTLWSSLAESQYVVRYLLTWVALEALMGPRGGGELKFRIAQRLSLFLSDDRTGAQTRFAQLKEAYDLRSKIVHRGRPKMASKKAMSMLQLSEEALREALVKVLSDESLAATFSTEKSRDDFLDSLVFAEKGGAI